MQRDRVDFKEALRILAEAAGIELPAYSGQQNSGERQTLSGSEFRRLFVL